MIDSQYPAIEVFRRERNNLWVLYAYVLHDVVELTSLDVHFPVSEAYEGVTFPPDDNEQPQVD